MAASLFLSEHLAKIPVISSRSDVESFKTLPLDLTRAVSTVTLQSNRMIIVKCSEMEIYGEKIDVTSDQSLLDYLKANVAYEKYEIESKLQSGKYTVCIPCVYITVGGKSWKPTFISFMVRKIGNIEVMTILYKLIGE